MVSVGIVGAGFSGLGMAIKLQKAGLKDFTIFEAAADIGGMWQANRYPGCACDVQSTMYSLSFEPYPWSEVYSGQPEILQYLHHCAGESALCMA
jgi:cation diffusion facilitator CzcD-associated flavoprotein CzcO